MSSSRRSARTRTGKSYRRGFMATASPAEPTPVSPGPPAPSFLDLVREARFDGMTLSAFGGRHLDLGDFLSFETDEDAAGEPLRLIFDRGAYRPGHGGS